MKKFFVFILLSFLLINTASNNISRAENVNVHKSPLSNNLPKDIYNNRTELITYLKNNANRVEPVCLFLPADSLYEANIEEEAFK